MSVVGGNAKVGGTGRDGRGGSGVNDDFVYPNGRRSLDLARRLRRLPNEAKPYRYAAPSGEERDALSIMEDSPTAITPPTQPSEAMYLQQEWAKTSQGQATNSPACIADFPAADDYSYSGGDEINVSNHDDEDIYLADNEENKNSPLPTQAHMHSAAKAPSATFDLAPISTKKKSEDLLAQMRKTRFFTSALFFKRKCGSISTNSRKKTGKMQNGTASKEKTARSFTRSETLTSAQDMRPNAFFAESSEYIDRQSRRNTEQEKVIDSTNQLSDHRSNNINNTEASSIHQPSNVKNRASSGGCQSRSNTRRRIQEVLSGITFDLPVVKATTEIGERPGGESFIGRARSDMDLASTCTPGQCNDGSVDDSVSICSDCSSSTTALQSDSELFYDSDPGIVSPISNNSGIASGCASQTGASASNDIGTIEDGVHLLSMDNSFDDERSFDAMFDIHQDEELVLDVLEGVKSRRMELIWHPTISTSDQERFDGHTAPLRCTAWIEVPGDLETLRSEKSKLTWHPSDPHSVVSRRRLQASKNAPYSIDLADVVDVESAYHIDRREHPFGRSQDSFVIRTVDGTFLFQAPSDADKEKNIQSIQLIVTRQKIRRASSSTKVGLSNSLTDSMRITTIDDNDEKRGDFLPHLAAFTNDILEIHEDIEVVLPPEEGGLPNILMRGA